MDAITFDVLIKRLAARRLTRLTAVRGLAAGVAAALTGVSLTTDEAGADRKKPTKVRICHRGDNFAIFGTTKQLKEERWQKHRRKHEADYRGRCTAEKSGLTDGGGCGSCPAA